MTTAMTRTEGGATMEGSLKQVLMSTVVAGVMGLDGSVLAGPPLNSFQGVGGMGLNPLAWTAGQAFAGGAAGRTDWQDLVSKPQIGGWYVRLEDIDANWQTYSVAGSLFGKRLELSYGHEIIETEADCIGKNDVGAKLLVLPENAGDTAFVPAIAVGGLWKNTDFDAQAISPNADDSGYDLYLVATKMITQLPRPLLISGGVLNSDEWVMGAFGHDHDRDWTWFANLDVLPFPFLAVGVEYKQGSEFPDWHNANYWDAHVGWLANQHLTVCLAYIDGGDEKSASRVGLGDCLTVTLQYAF
jgi:hypothetical protein